MCPFDRPALCRVILLEGICDIRCGPVERVRFSPSLCCIIYQSNCTEFLWRRCPGLFHMAFILE